MNIWRLLAVGRRRKGDDAKHARADLFGDRLDGAAFAGGVASFEHDDDALIFLRFHPLLEMAKLNLKLASSFS